MNEYKTVIRLVHDLHLKSLTRLKIEKRLNRFEYDLKDDTIDDVLRGKHHLITIIPTLEKDVNFIHEEIKLMVWLMNGYRVYLEKIVVL